MCIRDSTRPSRERLVRYSSNWCYRIVSYIVILTAEDGETYGAASGLSLIHILPIWSIVGHTSNLQSIKSQNISSEAQNGNRSAPTSSDLYKLSARTSSHLPNKNRHANKYTQGCCACMGSPLHTLYML